MMLNGILQLTRIQLTQIILPLMYSCQKRTAKQFKEGLYRKTPPPTKTSSGFRNVTPFADLSGTQMHHDDRSSCLSQESITPNQQKKQWLGRCIEKVEYTFNSRLEQPKPIELSATSSSIKTAYKAQAAITSFGYLEGTFVEHKGKIVRLQEKMRFIFDEEDEMDEAMDGQEQTEFTYFMKDGQDYENKVFDEEDENLGIFARTICAFEPKFKDHGRQKSANSFFSSRKTVSPSSMTEILGSSKLN